MVLVSVVFFFFEKMIDGHIKADEATALILMLIVFLIAARRYIIAKIVALVIISLFFTTEFWFLHAADFMSLILELLALVMVRFSLYIISRAPFHKQIILLNVLCYYI